MNPRAGRVGLLSLLVGFAFQHSACEPVRHYNRLQVASFEQGLPRRPYGSVKVFREASDIDRPYDRDHDLRGLRR